MQPMHAIALMKHVIDNNGNLYFGTTDNFMALNAKDKNVHPTSKTNVVIPYGNTTQSLCKCDIDWPLLLSEATSSQTMHNNH